MNIHENLDLFECVFDEPESHFLIEPLTLSCSHFICKACIPKNGEIYCKRCNEHNRNDLSRAKESILMKRLFTLNLEDILKIIRDKFHGRLTHLKDNADILTKNYELKLQYIKEEIEIRVESLKVELDQLKEEFTSELDAELVHFKSEMLDEKSINDFSDDLELIKKQIEHKIKVGDSGLREYQKKIMDMNSMNEKLKKCNPEISMSISSFKMERDFIAKVKLSSLQSTINIRKVASIVEYPVGSCMLQNEVVIQSNFNDCTLSLHKKGQGDDTIISKIGTETFQAFGVTTDEVDRVFISDWLNNRIIVADEEFNFLQEIGAHGIEEDELNSPADIYYFDQSIYVCDAGNKRVKRLNAIEFNVEKVLNVDYTPIYVKANERFLCIGDVDTYTIFIYEVDTFTSYDKVQTQHYTKFFIPADELLIFSCQHDKVSCYTFDDKTQSHTKLSSVLTSF